MVCFLLLTASNVFAFETEWSSGIEPKVRIISPVSHNDNKNEIFLGLQYKLEKGWKTYWRSSGDGGFPQEIKLLNSQNVKDFEILWPIPEYFEILGFTSIGYVDEVIFPLKINLQDINKKTFINLDINYLTCKDICIPGSALLNIIIPPGEGKITEHSYKIQKALSLVPKIDKNLSGLRNFTTKAYEDDEDISIIISAESKNIFTDPKIFLHSEFGLPISKPEIIFSPNSKKIDAKFFFNKKNISKDNFKLNIVFDNENNSFEYISDIKVEQFSKIAFLNNSLIYLLLISLFGGMILNVMPCVLPVLSIKLISVLRQSTDLIAVRKSFITTSLGIITSFLILSILLMLLRSLGFAIGWGMQFQQPLFLIIISIILLLFSFNLLGFFEFKTPSFVNMKIINDLNSKNYTKDFFNGFFATILATPCSAPFVGTAITAAFTQSTFTMYAIFIFMGLGMSSPYLLVAIFPSVMRYLPKPGKWMQYIKYFLGLLLLGTFLWIFSILLNHFTFFQNIKINQNSNWIDITEIDLDNLKKEKNIIFVDITADWCVTCQFNKINVINSKIVKNEFKKNNIMKIRGDWTKPNAEIADFLQQYKRFGIPFNIFFSKTFPDGIILSEILSEKEVLDTIEKIN